MGSIWTRLVGMAGPRLLLVGALALGVLSTQAGGGTLAYFTTTATSTGNTFTAGTLALKTGAGGLTTAFTVGGTAPDLFRPGRAAMAQLTLDLDSTSVPIGSAKIEITRASISGGGDSLDKRIKWSAATYTSTQGSCAGMGASGSIALPGGSTSTVADPRGGSAPSATADGAELSAITEFIARTDLLAVPNSDPGGPKYVCVRAEWVDGTDLTDTQLTDNLAKLGVATYTFTVTAYQTDTSGITPS